MGTIVQRKNKNGDIKYTAQIRLRRGGVIVYQETQSFDRKLTAQAWLKLRETELAAPGAIERANRKAVLLKDVIGQYLEEVERVRPLGKTKRATLKAIGDSWLGELKDVEVTSQRLVEFAQWRLSDEGGGVQGQTIGNDLSHLGAVLSVAGPAWGHQIDAKAVPDARKVLRKLGMNTRSEERDRRPTLEELDRLLEYFFEVLERRRNTIHMPKVIAFAIFSTRRQDEITRIRWDGLDEARQAALIVDMKNPGQKIGNNVWCHLPDEAWAILHSMPRTAGEVFPYNSGTISSVFARACKVLEIEDLHFHDLRHDGVSRLFEMDWEIPRVAFVSGHREWKSLRRYTHLHRRGDSYKDWPWLQRIIDAPPPEGVIDIARLLGAQGNR